MPFTANDPKLPSNVQKLDEAKRKKWASTWNSSFNNCMNENKGGGAGTQKKCETLAFKIANGTIKGVEMEETPKTDEMESMDLGCAHQAGEKCIACQTNAVSWAEVDEAQDMIEKQEKTEELFGITEGLTQNVMRSPDIPADQKPNAIQGVMNGFIDRLKRLSNPIKALFKREKKTPSFMITKDKQGNLRWVGIPTNKWRDRDNPPQIIAEAALKEYESYVERTKEYPVLMAWHTPGTEMGVADIVAYDDSGFLIMSGTINKGMEEAAEKLAEKCEKEDIGMSHGFVYEYADKENEVIGKIRPWEVSHLPVEFAANTWTSIDILTKEAKMINGEKKAYFVDLFGEDFINSLESKNKDNAEALIGQGIEYKEIEEKANEEKETQVDVVKAITESEPFKVLVDTALDLAQKTVPEITDRLDKAEKAIEEVKKLAQKKIDDAVSETWTAESQVEGHQASKAGEAPTEDEQKEAPMTEGPYDEDGIATGMKTGFPGA